MNNFSAVIFDLDGTLADSLQDIADAMNRTLTHFNYPVYNYEEYKYFVGKGLKSLVYQCLPEGRKEEKYINETLSVMMMEYEKSCTNETALYKGISELLTALINKDYKLAILSNKADTLTQKIVNRLFNNWEFSVVLGANERFPRKPAPDAALFIADEMNIDTKEILYLGDTDIDMKTANAAGMYAVGVSWGFRTKEELAENGAKQIIDYPTDLLNLLC